MKMTGQARAPWRVRRRFLAVPVAAGASLLLAVSAVQPAVAHPLPAAGNAGAHRAIPAETTGQKTFTDELQKAVLKFAAQKLAGFAFSQLGLSGLLEDPTATKLDELQTQIAKIDQQQQDLQSSLSNISGDIAELLLSTKETRLTTIMSGIDTLYNYFYFPAITALTEYVRQYIDAKGDCTANPCLAAKVKYEGEKGNGGLRQKFLDQFTIAGAAPFGQELHNFILPGPSGDSLMGAYGLFLARKHGFLTSADSAEVRNYFNFWADYRSLAMWMIAQWMSVEDPTTGFNTVINQIDSWDKVERDTLPPVIPEKTVIALPPIAAERTSSTAKMPMWGFHNNQLPVGFAGWDPYNNATGVPEIIRQMNTNPAAGYGFNNWAVPSRAELDALLARGQATQTGKEFLLSLNSTWPALLGPDLDTTPYIWTTQDAGVPSWTNSFAIPCENFNGASFVTVKTLTGYVHTAVGPVTGALSGFPAQYKNYNRPDPHVGKIQTNLRAPNTVPDIIKACEAILKDDIGKASTGTNPYAVLLATRSTGDVNYLPYHP